MSKLCKSSYVLILAIFTLSCACIANPAFAIIPQVQNVVVYDIGGTTYLNITVYHDPEISSHHVDTIEVAYDTNTTDLPIDVQSSTTFIIVYVVGVLTDTPTATVRAHCNVHGWSDVNWTGPITEFPYSLLPLVFLLIMSLAIIAIRKITLKT